MFAIIPRQNNVFHCFTTLDIPSKIKHDGRRYWKKAIYIRGMFTMNKGPIKSRLFTFEQMFLTTFNRIRV